MKRGEHRASIFHRETTSPGAGIEQRRAAEALARLRAENRRNEGRPYRAATLAEAEKTAGPRDENVTPPGILRENALRGKSGQTSQPRRTPE